MTTMPAEKKNCFVVRDANRHHRFLCDNISYINCDGYVCTLHRIVGQSVNVSKSMNSFETMLAGMHFFRISRDIIVNLNHISLVECKGRKRTLVLKCGERLSIADRRWAGFKAKYYSNTLTAKTDALTAKNNTPEKKY